MNFLRRIRQNMVSKGDTTKYLKYAIGEIALVVIGILIALSINNWNQERINGNKIQSKLNLVHKELIQDIGEIEKEIRNRDEKRQLMSRALQIIDEETSLSIENRQLLDSAFLIYYRIEPLYNNMRSYETFLSTESNFIDDEIYLKLNTYVDFFNEVNARVERFADASEAADYNILFNSSVRKSRSGKFEYSFKIIQQEPRLHEIIRNSMQHFQSVTRFYSTLLEKATELEKEIKKTNSTIVYRSG